MVQNYILANKSKGAGMPYSRFYRATVRLQWRVSARGLKCLFLHFEEKKNVGFKKPRITPKQRPDNSTRIS